MTDEYVAIALRSAWERVVDLTKEAEKNGFNVRITNHEAAVREFGNQYFCKAPSDKDLQLDITKTVKY